ncbi:MAG: putative toxin-antitoxin system toxin component, PIN family [Prevotella sp.]|nr:putative toxin-antitoxin system toxin component, PIN family [Prevotella sp.]
MIFAVIDTNVLVSARITKNSSSATVKVLDNMFNGIVIPIFNDEIIAEYTDVLHRPKF